jgi:hypothetical protein
MVEYIIWLASAGMACTIGFWMRHKELKKCIKRIEELYSEKAYCNREIERLKVDIEQISKTPK